MVARGAELAEALGGADRGREPLHGRDSGIGIVHRPERRRDVGVALGHHLAVVAHDVREHRRERLAVRLPELTRDGMAGRVHESEQRPRGERTTGEVRRDLHVAARDQVLAVRDRRGQPPRREADRVQRERVGVRVGLRRRVGLDRVREHVHAARRGATRGHARGDHRVQQHGDGTDRRVVEGELAVHARVRRRVGDEAPAVGLRRGARGGRDRDRRQPGVRGRGLGHERGEVDAVVGVQVGREGQVQVGHAVGRSQRDVLAAVHHRPAAHEHDHGAVRAEGVQRAHGVRHVDVRRVGRDAVEGGVREARGVQCGGEGCDDARFAHALVGHDEGTATARRDVLRQGRRDARARDRVGERGEAEHRLGKAHGGHVRPGPRLGPIPAIRRASPRSRGRSRAAGSRSCPRRSCGFSRRGASAPPGTRACSRSRRGSGSHPR